MDTKNNQTNIQSDKPVPESQPTPNQKAKSDQ